MLRICGTAALALAGVLLVRQTVFHGGQPDAPTPLPTAAPVVTAAPDTSRVTVLPLAATRDALSATQDADLSAHTTPETAAAPPAVQTATVLPQYRALYAENPDLIGWLRIDGTDIDLPVVQTPGDNEYYLRRGFDRFYAVGGTLFLDDRCAVSGNVTANWLVYGHNMRDGSMFGQLVRYRDEAFYQAHPTFTFDTLYETGTWQVVAALDTTLGADALPYYTFFDADTKLDWQHRVDAILAKALYTTGVTPEYGCQLLTLSTCGDTRPGTDARFALLAMRVAENP